MNELKKRKHPRLDNYDYSSAGAYFITICTKERRRVLSRVVWRDLAPAEEIETVRSVGRGLAPAEEFTVEYTALGMTVEKQLLLLEERFSHLTIDRYMIMPNHIHVIMILANETAGASPRPTVMDIVSAFKSLTVRECRTIGFDGALFQASFYEHIIRNREDYLEHVKYIHENPIKWRFDELYTEE